jgi:dihydropteroate synthase
MVFRHTYEGVMGVPQLIASANRPAAILATGSPVRYFAPIAPAAVGGTATVLAQSWGNGGNRRQIAAATTTLGAAVGLTAYRVPNRVDQRAAVARQVAIGRVETWLQRTYSLLLRPPYACIDE